MDATELTFDLPEGMQPRVTVDKNGVLLRTIKDDNYITMCHTVEGFQKWGGSGGDTVVDVGASIGFFSLIMAALDPHRPVWAIEPHPVLFSYLVQNVLKNRLTNIVTIPAAVWTVSGAFLPFRQATNFDEQSGLVYHEKAAVITPAVSITLPQLLTLTGAKQILLKMDIEGAEHGIFDTLTPEHLAPVRMMHLETHDLRGDQFFRQDLPWLDLNGEVMPRLGFRKTPENDLWVRA